MESRNRAISGVREKQVSKDLKIIETDSTIPIVTLEHNRSTSINDTHYFFNEMPGLAVKIYPKRIWVLEQNSRLGIRVPKGNVHIAVFEPTQLYGQQLATFRANMQDKKINPILRAQRVDANVDPMSIYLDTLVAQEIKDSGEIVSDRLNERVSILWAESPRSRYASLLPDDGLPKDKLTLEAAEAIKRNPPIEVVITDPNFVQAVKEKMALAEKLEVRAGQAEVLLDYRDSVGMPNTIIFNYTPGIKVKVLPETIKKIYEAEGLKMPLEYKVLTVLSPAIANPESYNKIDEEIRKNEEERLLSEHYKGQKIKYQIVQLFIHQAIGDTLSYRPQFNDEEKRMFISRELSFRWIEQMQEISNELAGNTGTTTSITEATRELVTQTPPIEILSIDTELIEKVKNQPGLGGAGR